MVDVDPGEVEKKLTVPPSLPCCTACRDDRLVCAAGVMCGSDPRNTKAAGITRTLNEVGSAIVKAAAAAPVASVLQHSSSSNMIFRGAFFSRENEETFSCLGWNRDTRAVGVVVDIEAQNSRAQ